MLALIGNIETTELLVVLIGAILVFGKRLPQVASEAGAQLGKLRRTLDSAWRDSGVDREVREMQRSIESIREAVPRDLSAGSVARLAANEFQRRVEQNQRGTEEAGAAGAPAAPGALLAGGPPVDEFGTDEIPAGPPPTAAPHPDAPPPEREPRP